MNDPYAPPPPTLWQRHPQATTAVVVFILTALLTVVSFPPFKMPEFAYAALVPGIFWAYLRPRFKVYAWTLLASQAVAWTIVLSWLHYVTWLGWLLLGPIVGCWIGLWYLAVWWTIPRMLGRPTPVRLLAMLGLAGAWIVVEWSRTWLLGGFPWLPLSASQWERASILQISAYTGAYGVSFVLVAMNVGFAAYAHRLFREGATGFGRRSQEFFLAMFLLLACLSVHVQETFNRLRFTVPLGRVAFVQPYIPQEIKWDPAKGQGILQVLEQTTLAAARTRPDLILWPEATTPWAVRGDATVKDFIESLARRSKATLLIGSIAIERDRQPGEAWYNGVFAIDPVTGLQTSYYAKRHLVPFGEYVPLRPVLGWLSKIVPVGDDFAHGLDAAPLVLSLPGGVFTFGPLVCYEDIYPQLARSSVLSGADVLVVQTNNAWFGEGGAAYQHAANSVLRAVETRRPVLRCGNGGWSGWIDEFGSIRAVLTNDEGSIYFRGTKTIAVARDSRWVNRLSFYVEHGDWFVGVSAGLALFGFLLLRTGGPRPEQSSPGPARVP
ncbi:MAG: apolipoprotein N-acyltransferase [Verrucomicrobia bacterium]|nr:apolipoprotein N-acyltransferase [Verrucomicrobiota bacterium]